MSDAKRGTCQLCDWEGQLTKNGRMRSHKGDPEKGLLENGNCPKGSDFPRETAPAPAPKTASGGPNPHRAPLAPDAPLSAGPTCPLCGTMCGGVCTAQDRAQQRIHDPNCDRCDTDNHRCPGCGNDVPHGTVVCADCQVFYADDPKLEQPVNPDAESGLDQSDAEPAEAADFFGGGALSDEDDAAGFFDGDEPEQAPSKGRWFPSRYDGSCDTCGAYFMEGDDIRADGEGGWECRDHDEEDGDSDATAAPKPPRPRRVSPKPPLRAGRYRLPHPETGKPSAFSRTTTFVKLASDSFGLKQWEMRSALVGLSRQPDLLDQINGLDVKKDRERLNALADMAKDAAGAKDRASTGTKMHKWTEEVDSGRLTLDQVPDEFRTDVRRYREVLEASGYRVVPHLIERTTVVAELGVVGTFDQVWQAPDGRYVIVDKKTGELTYGQMEIAAQLAVYAHGANAHGVAEWDPALGDADDPAAWVWRRPTDEDGNRIDIDMARGVVVHMPQDGRGITLYEVDLITGWEHARLCAQVRASHKVKSTMAPIELPDRDIVETRREDGPSMVDQWREQLYQQDLKEAREMVAAADAEAAQPAPDAESALLARIAPQRISADSAPVQKAVAQDPAPALTWAERFRAVKSKDDARAVLKAARDAGMPKERQTQLIEVATRALELLNPEPPF